MALDYIRSTQSGALPRLAPPEPQGQAGLFRWTPRPGPTWRSAIRDGGTRYTLLTAVQRTMTAAGVRYWRRWLSAPLTDRKAIAARQDAWSWCVANSEGTNRLRAILRPAPDMARALGRLSLNRGGPRDLAAIRDGLNAAAGSAEILQDRSRMRLPTCKVRDPIRFYLARN